MKDAVLNPLLKKPKCSCTCKPLLLSALLLGLGNPVLADDLTTPPAEGSTTILEQKEAPATPPALPADAPESDDSRNIPTPEVTIIHKKEMTIEEYRVDGKLRYAKITPKQGKPYYLVDRDGDGVLESRHNAFDGPPPINQWILLEW